MIVDEEKNYALTHYFKKNGVNCKKDSNHNTLVLDMKKTMDKMRKERTEFFNFRNSECQKVFHQITNQSEKLIDCFNNKQTLSQQCNKWFKELNSIFHQSFKKIRVGGKIKETEFSSLMKRKNELKQKAKLADDSSNQEVIDELLEIEAKLSEQVAVKNRNKVIENFGSIAINEGALNVNGMWDLQKKIFPKNPPSLPTAKSDVDGRILTSHKDLQNLYFIRVN